MGITITIDGHQIDCAPGTTVADAYIAHPDHDGTSLAREGCGIGTCNDCTVISGEREVKSCLSVARDGLTITSLRRITPTAKSIA